MGARSFKYANNFSKPNMRSVISSALFSGTKNKKNFILSSLSLSSESKFFEFNQTHEGGGKGGRNRLC